MYPSRGATSAPRDADALAANELGTHVALQQLTVSRRPDIVVKHKDRALSFLLIAAYRVFLILFLDPSRWTKTLMVPSKP